eukprot:m.76044 g.76044  ORF g.76044 m.76044 type:complete len:328 (-) comp12474_c0_seq1:528-1511(-)
MSQHEAIEYYKRLNKALLDKTERAQLQRVLATFVQTKSFDVLATNLPPILNTSRKRAILPALKQLIPPEFHHQFDTHLQHLGLAAWTTVDKQTALDVRKRRVEAEVQLQEQARQQMESLGVSSPGSSFDAFLEKQRSLSRHSTAEEAPRIPSRGLPASPWGYLADDSTIGALEFTDKDEIKYADVEEIDEMLSELPPPVPQRRSQPTSGATSPLPERRVVWLPEWYNNGQITRQESEDLLHRFGFSEGLFLVRAKDSQGVSYCLSIVHKAKVMHVLLQRPTANHIFTIDGETYGHCFTPEEMIESLRELGESFEFTLRRPLRMPANM